MKQKLYLIIDAGGTYFKSALLDASAEIIPSSIFQTRSYSEDSAGKIINAYRETINHGLAYLEKDDRVLSGIGIATPGPFDYDKGIPLMKHKFASVHRLSLTDFFYSIPGIQNDLPICYMHDANAALAGELWKGNAKGVNNAGLITLGTGLGFAYSQNGEIQYNMEGGPGKSIYTLPYKDGILEDYASKRGFLKIYNEKSKKSDNNIDVSDIGKWADEGEIESIETFNEVGHILAEALCDIIDEKSLECLLFGGQISRSFYHMEESLKTGLGKVKSLKKISVVKNINNTTLYGVLWKLLNDEPYKNKY